MLVLDLIITGAMGLKNKEIYSDRTFLGLFFIPLGMIGWVLRYFHGKASKVPDKGDAAIASSIACMALGFLVAAFFLPYYADKHALLPNNLLKVLIPTMLVIIILGTPLAIAVAKRN